MCTHNDKIDLLAKGIDCNNRRLFITDEIELNTVLQIDIGITSIIDMTKDDKSPITLVIRSYGGDAYSAFGIVDLMQQVSMPINTLINGTAQSAAGIIAVCGTGQRAMSTNATLLLHQVSLHDIEASSAEQLGNLTQVSTNLNNKQAILLAQKSDKPKEFWVKHLKKEKHLSAQEALELKLVDIIQ